MIGAVLLLEAALVQAAPAAPTCAVRTASNETVDLAAVPRDRYAIDEAAVGGGRRLVTVFRTQNGQRLPVAVGFCSAAAMELADPSRSGADVPGRLDPRARPDSCALSDAAGRAAVVEYAPFRNGQAYFASAGGWPWAKGAAVSRGAGAVGKARVRVTRLGSRRGLVATEYFYVSGSDAANLVLFDSLGTASGADAQAAMICSYTNVTRGPALQ